MKTDPFTRTPGIAGKAYIDMHYADTIVNNFENNETSKYIYKIVGLRGSGKSVEYSKVLNHFQNDKRWLVYTLSAAGNPLEVLIAKLSHESFIKSTIHETTKNSSISAGGTIKLIGANTSIGISSTTKNNEHYYSDEAELSFMLKEAEKKQLKVLVGIDDIARTPEMVRFLSIWGSLLLEGYRNIYLVCTGLVKNIEDFTEERNLTFFKRSDLIEIKGLSKFEVAYMYQKLLNLDELTAVKLAKMVKGYAYAYQVLGSLYFNKQSEQCLEDLIPEFQRIIFQDSYNLIFKSLTKAEKELVKIIVNTQEGNVSDIKRAMDNPNSFNVLRSRLEKKHLLNLEQRGYVKIELPFFREYINLWEDY